MRKKILTKLLFSFIFAFSFVLLFSPKQAHAIECTYSGGCIIYVRFSNPDNIKWQVRYTTSYRSPVTHSTVNTTKTTYLEPREAGKRIYFYEAEDGENLPNRVSLKWETTCSDPVTWHDIGAPSSVFDGRRYGEGQIGLWYLDASPGCHATHGCRTSGYLNADYAACSRMPPEDGRKLDLNDQCPQDTVRRYCAINGNIYGFGGSSPTACAVLCDTDWKCTSTCHVEAHDYCSGSYCRHATRTNNSCTNNCTDNKCTYHSSSSSTTCNLWTLNSSNNWVRGREVSHALCDKEYSQNDSGKQCCSADSDCAQTFCDRRTPSDPTTYCHRWKYTCNSNHLCVRTYDRSSNSNDKSCDDKTSSYGGVTYRANTVCPYGPRLDLTSGKCQASAMLLTYTWNKIPYVNSRGDYYKVWHKETADSYNTNPYVQFDYDCSYRNGITVPKTIVAHGKTTTAQGKPGCYFTRKVKFNTQYSGYVRGTWGTTTTQASDREQGGDRSITTPSVCPVVTYTINGNIFIDNNTRNTKKDAAEVNYTKPLDTDDIGDVSITRLDDTPVSGADVVSTTGLYNVELSTAGTYLVKYSGPPSDSGYRMTTPTQFQVTVGGGTACAHPPGYGVCSGGSINNLNFGVGEAAGTWTQCVGGDCLMNTRNSVPYNYVAPGPPTPKTCNGAPAYASIDKTAPQVSDAGILIVNPSTFSFCPSFGAPNPSCVELGSVSKWVVGLDSNYAYSANRELGYDYLLSKYSSSPATIFTNDSGAYVNLVSDPADARNYVFKTGDTSDDLTVTNTSHLYTFINSIPSDGKNIIVFVAGDLNLNTNILFPPTKKSTLAFIVKGNIIVDKSVSVLEGWYSADNTFVISGTEGDTCPTADPALDVNGAVAAFGLLAGGNIDNQRDLCVSTCPVFRITQRLDFVLNAPPKLNTTKSTWKEKAP